MLRIILLTGLLCGSITLRAGEVSIVDAILQQTSPGIWTASVTLQHEDIGWDHYADAWRVVDTEGHVLGERVLYHPHVDEQPFTRGLADIVIPAAVTLVYIEAHDKVHGWSKNRMEVRLAR